jgi:hypothetical protein
MVGRGGVEATRSFEGASGLRRFRYFFGRDSGGTMPLIR